MGMGVGGWNGEYEIDDKTLARLTVMRAVVGGGLGLFH